MKGTPKNETSKICSMGDSIIIVEVAVFFWGKFVIYQLECYWINKN